MQRVLLGKYEMETWYFSPYPEDYSKLDKVCVSILIAYNRAKRLNLNCYITRVPWAPTTFDQSNNSTYAHVECTLCESVCLRHSVGRYSRWANILYHVSE